jgi:signal transduction histidine kinase
VEVWAGTLAGEERILRMGMTPLAGGDGGSILSFQDITVEHGLRQEMEKMNRLATVAEIASAVAHEVRNPLAGIKTMGQAIEERMAADDANREYVTRIVRQVDRINHLLTEFFTYARPPEPQMRDVDLGETVADTLQLVSARMRRHGIRTSVDIAADARVVADPAQVQQVLLNLLLNAVQAIDEDGGEIRVSAARVRAGDLPAGTAVPAGIPARDEYVRLSVRDSGRGIPAGLRDKVFEPFFTTRHDGTGLGLAIVYRILKENGAFVRVDSVPGRTTFDIYFEAAA